jgi:hypothetical protein
VDLASSQRNPTTTSKLYALWLTLLQGGVDVDVLIGADQQILAREGIKHASLLPPRCTLRNCHCYIRSPIVDQHTILTAILSLVQVQMGLCRCCGHVISAPA